MTSRVEKSPICGRRQPKRDFIAENKQNLARTPRALDDPGFISQKFKNQTTRITPAKMRRSGLGKSPSNAQLRESRGNITHRTGNVAEILRSVNASSKITDHTRPDQITFAK